MTIFTRSQSYKISYVYIYYIYMYGFIVLENRREREGESTANEWWRESVGPSLKLFQYQEQAGGLLEIKHTVCIVQEVVTHLIQYTILLQLLYKMGHYFLDTQYDPTLVTRNSESQDNEQVKQRGGWPVGVRGVQDTLHNIYRKIYKVLIFNGQEKHLK